MVPAKSPATEARVMSLCKLFVIGSMKNAANKVTVAAIEIMLPVNLSDFLLLLVLMNEITRCNSAANKI